MKKYNYYCFADMSAQQAYVLLNNNKVISAYAHINRIKLYFHRCDGVNLTDKQAYGLSQNMDGISRVVKACLYENDWYVIRLFLLLNEDCTSYSYIPYLPGEIKEECIPMYAFLSNVDWELFDEYWRK